MTTRRSLLVGVSALLLVGAAPATAVAGPRRRVRRRVSRRRVRRRIRRRVRFRTVGARRLLVLPVAARVGWELEVDGGLMVIESFERDGDVEIVVVRGPNGTLHRHAILREDDADNAVELQGSEVSGDDESVPYVETEEG